MKYHVPADRFEAKVKALQKFIAENNDMPPLIVHYVEGEFELNDGNHRFEAYLRMGVAAYYVIVWITEKEEYADFMEKYAKYMES